MPNFTADPKVNSPSTILTSQVLDDSLQDPAKGRPRNGTCRVQQTQVAPATPSGVLGTRFLVGSGEARSRLTLFLLTLVAPGTSRGAR